MALKMQKRLQRKNVIAAISAYKDHIATECTLILELDAKF